MRRAIWLQTPTVFGLGGGTVFPAVECSHVHGHNDVRQTEIHTAEQRVPEPSDFEFDLAIEKLKSHKSPDTDQIPAELIKAGVEQFVMRFINLLFLLGIWRNCLRIGRSRSLYLSIRRAIAVITEAYHFCQIRTNFIQHPAVTVNSICR